MSTPPSVPRSLTQMLRERDDAVLTRLLLDRPDLAFPQPTSLSDVASRATTRHSVTDALSGLNAFENWVATLASGMPAPFAVADLPIEDAHLGSVRDAIVRLVDLGLLWGDPVGLTALRAVRAMSAMLEDVTAGPPPATIPPELPFAVRPGCPEVAESRGARDSGPKLFGRSLEGQHARPRGPDGGS